MRKASVTLLLVLACAICAAAQSQSGSATGQGAGSTSSSSASKDTQGKSIEGCLKPAASTDHWTLQTKNMGAVMVMPNKKLKDEIGKHVNHTVRLEGSWEEAKSKDIARADTNRSDLPQSDQSTSQAAREFKAERLDMIASMCPEPGTQLNQGTRQTQPGDSSTPSQPRSAQPGTQEPQPPSQRPGY